MGGDAVQGWVDLAKLVSGGGGFKSVYKELAQKIGTLPRCLQKRADSLAIFPKRFFSASERSD